MIINVSTKTYSDLIQIAQEYNLDNEEQVIKMLIPTKINPGEI